MDDPKDTRTQMMERSKLGVVGDDRETPSQPPPAVRRSFLREKTRGAINFMAAPRVRNIGWYVLVFLVVGITLVHVNQWTKPSPLEPGLIARAWSYWWDYVWNGIGIVPFVMGGMLFRYLWPIREDNREE
jgi:hypothetical protein